MDSTTGTPDTPAGVPVVDLGRLVGDLRRHAESVREQRDNLTDWAARYAASMTRRAAYLDDLADTLDGRPRT